MRLFHADPNSNHDFIHTSPLIKVESCGVAEWVYDESTLNAKDPPENRRVKKCSRFSSRLDQFGNPFEI